MIPIILRLKDRYYACYTGNLSRVQLGNNLVRVGGREARVDSWADKAIQEKCSSKLSPPTTECTFTIYNKTWLNKTLTPLQL